MTFSINDTTRPDAHGNDLTMKTLTVTIDENEPEFNVILESIIHNLSSASSSWKFKFENAE